VADLAGVRNQRICLHVNPNLGGLQDAKEIESINLRRLFRFTEAKAEYAAMLVNPAEGLTVR
jgi:hypothetical protein